MRVGRVIDLSLPLHDETQVYPGDPAVRLTVAATIAHDGFNLLAVQMGSQSGTNVDAPRHFRDDGIPIDQVPLEYCVGPGVLIDVRGKAARDRISLDDIAASLDHVSPSSIVVFHTGWPQHYGTAAYFDHPFLDAAACQALLDCGVRTFCLDTQNIDETPDDGHPGEGFPVHHLIASAGGVIVENLQGLERIDFSDPLISVLPLRLVDSDGAPARAVAIELLP
jgi:kynurenine formamidase